ncbi:MAG: methenyltetrahydrofolate cyclohydrolase [Methylococcaceae bacterium]|jgi:formiminotetrahydrofolate cyclodeaminase
MTEIIQKPIDEFLDELASKSATPGGGSAAALMGAQAAALTSMVCNLTLGKPKYAEVEADMQALLSRSEQLRAQLSAMVKADVEVFDRVMASYALPKQTEDEKLLRSAAIQAVLKDATDVPLACVRACAEAIKLSLEAAEKGNVNVVSDAGVATMAAYAGLKSAALNVYVNAASLKDRDFAEAKLAELEEILDSAAIMAQDIYELVKTKL